MIARSHEPPIPYTVYTGKVYNWTAGSDTPAILLATQLLPPDNCVSAVAIGCVPSYTVSDVQVSIDAETAAFDGRPQILDPQSATTYPGGSYLLQTIDNNNGVTGAPWSSREMWFTDDNDPFGYIPWATSPPNITAVGTYSPWFHLLRHLHLLDPQQLMDDETIARTSEEVFSALWPSVLQPILTSRTLEETAAMAENRLISRVGSIRAIQVCLCILAALFFLVALWRPRTLLPRDPSSLFSMSLVLAKSDAMVRQLEGVGSVRSDALADHLRGAKYQLTTQADGTTSVIVATDKEVCASVS